jgi:calcineurin-like phosphoesterase
VIHLLGQVFVKYHVSCPFEAVEELLKNNKLGKDVDAIFVDFHAEATSEKMAMGKFLDGKVSAVIGSHTHIPTAAQNTTITRKRRHSILPLIERLLGKVPSLCPHGGFDQVDNPRGR